MRQEAQLFTDKEVGRMIAAALEPFATIIRRRVLALRFL